MWLSAAVKAGNAGFHIESYEFSFLKFWVPFLFVLVVLGLTDL